MTTTHNLFTGADLWKPRLFVLNSFASATADASSEDGDNLAVSVIGPQTYSAWQPSALPAWVRLTLGGAVTINYVACYVSEPSGCTFVAEQWNGSAWVACGNSVAPTTKGPLVWYFDNLSTAQVRIYVTGSTAPRIANVKAGITTVCPVGIPPGFVPASINPSDEYSNTMTNGGQILASELIRSEMSQGVTLEMLDPDWVRDDWAPVRTYLRTQGVYFAWDADDYPDELIYGMVEGSPQTSYSSATFMSLSFTLNGPSA